MREILKITKKSNLNDPENKQITVATQDVIQSP